MERQSRGWIQQRTGIGCWKLGFYFGACRGMSWSHLLCLFLWPVSCFWTAYEATVQRGAYAYREVGSRLNPACGRYWKIKWSIYFVHQLCHAMIETAKEIEIDLTQNSLKKIIVAGEWAVFRQCVARSMKHGERTFDLRPLWDDRGGSCCL